MPKKKDLFISIEDVKKLAKKTQVDYENTLKEYLHDLAESGEVPARAADAQLALQVEAVKTYRNIFNKLLTNLVDYNVKQGTR